MKKPVPLQKIISGGQTGADQAGLYAAEYLGLTTGGYLPKGCLTLAGSRYDLLGKFKMIECTKPGYPPRTQLNVELSDGTLQIAANWDSPGERLTSRLLEENYKPYFRLNFRSKNIPADRRNFRTWLRVNNIVILNVAGNSEQTAPGIHAYVREFLQTTLSGYLERT